MRTYLLCCVSLLVLSATACAQAPPLTPAQQTMLPAMDSAVVQETVALAAKAAQWRSTLTTLADEIKKTPETLAEQARLELARKREAVLQQIVTEIQQRSAPLRKLIAFNEQLGTLLRQPDFQQMLQGKAQAAVTERLLGEFRKVFDAIEVARRPAEYAKGFVETELRQHFLNKPYTAGDLKFKVLEANTTKSLFAPDASLTLVLQYQEGIEVKATGLYFAYRAGQLPEPKLDRMQVHGPDVAALASKGLGKLGDLIPAGLGVKIENPEFTGFEKDKNGRRAGIRFKIRVDLAKAFDLAPGMRFEPKGTVTVYTDGHVAADNLELKFADETTKLPLPGSGMMLDGYYVELNPKDSAKTVTIGTYLAPQATGKQGVCFKVQISFGFPVKGFFFEGDMLLAGSEKIGKVTGQLTKTEISGKILVPPEKSHPLSAIVRADGTFKIDREGLDARAEVTIFQALSRTMELILNWDGSGQFLLNDRLSLFGVDVSASINATFEKRFANLELTANLTVEVDGLPGFANVRAAVTAVAVKDKVDVTASGLGMTFQFTMANLNENLVARLRQELLNRMPQIVDLVFNEAKNLDIFNKNSALRKTLCEFDIFNRHSEANKIAQNLANTANNLMQQGGNLIQQGGQALQNVLPPLPDKPALPPLRLPGGGGGGILSGGGGGILGFGLHGPHVWLGVHPAMLAAQARDRNEANPDDDLQQRLLKLVGAVNNVHLHEKPAPQTQRTGKRRYAKATELHLRFERCAVAKDGETDAVLAFALRSTGFAATIHPDQPGRKDRRTGAEVKWVEVRLKNVYGNQAGARPTADIKMPNLRADYTYLPARQIAYDKIHELLEHFLPEVAIDGKQRFFEKGLIVKNETADPVFVWVQRRTKVKESDKQNWKWLPGEPGTSQALKFTVPAKKELKLEADVALHLPRIAGGTQTLKVPLTASRVRIWGESLQGDRWLEHKDVDLWLVQPDPKHDNDRRYYAKELQYHTHRITPKGKNRLFAERLLEFRNDTGEDLKVKVKYQGDKTQQWKTLTFTVAAGESYMPRDADGFRIRAAQMTFEAEGKHYRYDSHATEPLYLVALANDGRRVYQADALGTYTHVFRPPTAASASQGR